MVTRREILAFVHIEKAAGTTLNYILRKNFLFRHYDVRPFHASSGRLFRAKDFEMALRINPFLKSISGHSIAPYIPITNLAPNLQYITLLRDPIERYISQYYYWNNVLNKTLSFEEFLSIERIANFQTRKIAGSENLERAKTILLENFLLAGVVEQFNEFLLVLQKKLAPIQFDPLYQMENVASAPQNYLKTKRDILKNYLEEIISKNKLDIELYNFVKHEVFAKEKEDYGPQFLNDLERFARKLEGYKWSVLNCLDYLYRKLYLDPLTGIVRIRNGLPYRGSY